MSIEDVITAIIKAEGSDTNDPNDAGGRTSKGISERANPEAWADGKVTETEAREIYYRKYVVNPGLDKITDSNLQAQLVDFSVTSGPFIAIQKLQSILEVSVDGILGINTLAVLTRVDPVKVNNQLVAARIRMICQIVKKNPSQLTYLLGWCERALSFMR